MQEFEYKFVRIGESRLSAVFGVQDRARKTYETAIREQAGDGWRLVQIFAPGVAAFGAAKYYELIFEREISFDTEQTDSAGSTRLDAVSAG
jgi:uncharacterized protein DUF4177